MLDNVVVVPVEMSNDDLSTIIEISRRVNMARNEVIRMLIRLGFEKLMEGGVEEIKKVEKKRGGKK